MLGEYGKAWHYLQTCHFEKIEMVSYKWNNLKINKIIYYYIVQQTICCVSQDIVG